MNPKLITEHLIKAEEHVAEGIKHVERQRRLIENLSIDGHDVNEASALLQQFEAVQELHVQDRDRLRNELANLMNSTAEARSETHIRFPA